MTTTQTSQSTGLLKYGLTVGMTVMEGRGFYYPVDTAIGHNGRLYVVNRSLESVARGVRVTVCDIDSEYYGTFASFGEEDGQFVWASCGTTDSQDNVYVTDEYLHRITVFDWEGEFINNWGSHGSGEGELDGPSGISVDSDDNIYVADTQNHRIQKFTKSGVFLTAFGKEGNGDGRLKLPWGLTVAPDGNIYVADWGNDRVQKFSPDGKFIAKYGASGKGDGEFYRPSCVAVTKDGYMYVSDWGNERVQVLDPNGGFVQNLRGEATLSNWAENFLKINVEEGEARANANLDKQDIEFFDDDDPHEVSSHIEKFFWAPMSVKLDAEGRVYVTESNRHRIQVYERVQS